MSARLAAFLAVATLSYPATAHDPASMHATTNLPTAAMSAAATVDAFHLALKRGEMSAAARLLADNALIFEAGGAEHSKAEYSAAHLLADTEYEKAVASTVAHRSGNSDGRIAWIATEGRTKGIFRGKSIDRVTAETMLLRRVAGAWKITHIHWSSAPAPSSGPAMSEPLLARSVPANGSVVSAPVNDLQLYFSPPARLLEVTVVGPAGRMPMSVTSAGNQARYTLPVPALGKGSYSIDWIATAAGREDRGTFSFSVR